MPDPTLEELALTWATVQDGESGYAYAAALEDAGDIKGAADVYEQVWLLGYPVGYYGLAWLERTQGREAAAVEIMQAALDTFDDDDADGDLYAGVLGHWMWHFFGRQDAEILLRRGMNEWPSARCDFASLLRATGRQEEAERVFREGVARGESECFLPLGNLLSDTDREEEAEQLYRGGYALGDAFSAYNLARLLSEQGREVESAEWLWKAAQGGDDLAVTRLVENLDEDRPPLAE